MATAIIIIAAATTIIHWSYFPKLVLEPVGHHPVHRRDKLGGGFQSHIPYDFLYGNETDHLLAVTAIIFWRRMPGLVLLHVLLHLSLYLRDKLWGRFHTHLLSYLWDCDEIAFFLNHG